MYQFADRYCIKVAEMMSTSTRRSQRPGPVIVDDSAPHSPDANHDYLTTDYLENVSIQHRKENKFDGFNNFEHGGRRSQKSRNLTDEVYLGRGGEAMSILRIHPFPETPDKPESSTDTFIISAAACQEANSPVNTVFAELHSFRIPKKRAGIQSKTAEDDSFSEHSRENDYLRDHKESAQSSPRSVSDSPGHVRARNQKNDEEEHAAREEAAKERVRDIYELMERDEAIDSVNFEHVSPRRRRPVTPEEERRFRCLLGRLQPRMAGEQTVNPSLVDPAVISFTPKKNDKGYGVSNLRAQFRAAEEEYRSKGEQRSRSDSGYTSPETYSRPSTRGQSKTRQEISEGTGTETFPIQHQNIGSNDSGFVSPSKHSTLNPAAKEFSFTNVTSGFPTKRGGLSRAPVPDNLYFTPQLPPSNTASITLAEHDAAFQLPGLGLNGLPAHINIPINLVARGMPQASPNILSHINSLPNTTLPPPPGFGPLGAFPSLGGAPRPVPGLAPPPGLGLSPPPGFSPPPGLAPMPGLISMSRIVPSGSTGPFHHQFPAAASCNNPAHQNISPFDNSHASPRPSMTPLPPPAPPASFVPQVTNAPVLPSPTAPAAPVAAPFIRKNVPKPKVPNTTGQQYWEYVHEMRRMYEPGYAQKSKANQQKRFMKQLNKNGGTTTQS